MCIDLQEVAAYSSLVLKTTLRGQRAFRVYPMEPHPRTYPRQKLAERRAELAGQKVAKSWNGYFASKLTILLCFLSLKCSIIL